jgi:hypothetical protein
VLIAAHVAESERPAFTLAQEHLRRLIDRPFELEFNATDGAEISIASLLRDVESGEPLEGVRSRLCDVPPSFVCTVFRACEGDAGKLERIRRLNVLAAEISHETGCGVIDFDRMFGDIGARTLQTDYRLGGNIAREIAAYTIVRTILAAGLDDLIPDAHLTRARAEHDRVYKRDIVVSF